MSNLPRLLGLPDSLPDFGVFCFGLPDSLPEADFGGFTFFGFRPITLPASEPESEWGLLLERINNVLVERKNEKVCEFERV